MKPGDLIADHFRLQEVQKAGLRKLGILTLRDLLYHFPAHYGDTAKTKHIEYLAVGETATVFGKISKLKTGKAFYKKIPMATAEVTDDTGSIGLVWFNQPYIAKMIPDGALVRVDGKVSARKGKLHFSNPKIEKVAAVPIGVGDSLFGEGAAGQHLYPVYPESRGVTSNWLYHAVQKVIRGGILGLLDEPLPADILDKYSLPQLHTALIWIHAPRSENDAVAARKRFAFEEVFFIQLKKQRDRLAYQNYPAFVVEPDRDALADFIGRFPFTPTAAQHKAIAAILGDFARGKAMGRLLEGDVGSGKTAVAAATVFAVTTTRPRATTKQGTWGPPQDFGNLQTAYMCPTEILAAQHFESFIRYFRHLNVAVGLITRSGCRKFPSKVDPSGWTNISRAQLLKWVAGGEIPILIGTHALIQKTVKFKNLAYVIIDEQHRFGTAQRQKLVRKDDIAPHLLSMTATPIPRTLALTIYGDLDLTLLDEMPAGRKPIITEIVLPTARESVYEKIRAELKAGRQAYVICPRIDEPDPAKEMALQAKSVKEEAKRLKKSVFPEYELGILHSKMTPIEKEKVMDEFTAGKINILCATSVVEVGVNVQNATVIVIEGAERFGLAQLHQLRGRVIRSNHQAYCYAFADIKSKTSLDRLRALKTARNGFELAEHDLRFRGAGRLYGEKQWGISDIGMEALQNLKMVEAARTEAASITGDDPTLVNHPAFKDRIDNAEKEIHFE